MDGIALLLPGTAMGVGVGVGMGAAIVKRGKHLTNYVRSMACIGVFVGNQRVFGSLFSLFPLLVLLGWVFFPIHYPVDLNACISVYPVGVVDHFT